MPLLNVQSPSPSPETGSRGVAIAMFVVLLASYTINAMDRQLFPLLVPEVRRQYGFSLANAGFLSTIFTLGMAMAGLPTGYLLARFSLQWRFRCTFFFAANCKHLQALRCHLRRREVAEFNAAKHVPQLR